MLKCVSWIFLILQVNPAVAATPLPQLQCKSIFINSYIDKVIHDLANLHIRLELAKVQGSPSLMLTALNHDYKMKEQRLITYLEANQIMTVQELNKKISSMILNLQNKSNQVDKKEEQKKEEQKKNIKEALSPINRAQKIILHDIKPGKFKMGEIGKQVDVEITKPFAMMSTQMTQAMWAQLKIAMGEKDLDKINPSNFKTGDDGITAVINGIEVQMKPNHPVEQVSWDEVKEFIDGLNVLSGKDDAKMQVWLTKLIPDHKKGDVYDFPTEAQWEFVMRNQGLANNIYFDRNDESDLSKYAWYFENSGAQTHAVATKQARMIDGKPFYDLEGNVWEWVKDFWDWDRIELQGGKDPISTTGSNRGIRGGSWNNDAQILRSAYRYYHGPAIHYSNVGLRLVRTRP